MVGAAGARALVTLTFPTPGLVADPGVVPLVPCVLPLVPCVVPLVPCVVPPPRGGGGGEGDFLVPSNPVAWPPTHDNPPL